MFDIIFLSLFLSLSCPILTQSKAVHRDPHLLLVLGTTDCVEHDMRHEADLPLAVLRGHHSLQAVHSTLHPRLSQELLLCFKPRRYPLLTRVLPGADTVESAADVGASSPGAVTIKSTVPHCTGPYCTVLHSTRLPATITCRLAQVTISFTSECQPIILHSDTGLPWTSLLHPREHVPSCL